MFYLRNAWHTRNRKHSLCSPKYYATANSLVYQSDYNYALIYIRYILAWPFQKHCNINLCRIQFKIIILLLLVSIFDSLKCSHRSHKVRYREITKWNVLSPRREKQNSLEYHDYLSWENYTLVNAFGFLKPVFMGWTLSFKSLYVKFLSPRMWLCLEVVSLQRQSSSSEVVRVGPSSIWLVSL